MDEIFGIMDGRFEVSLADSTMMWIVHYAMNRAQERMKTKTGVIERLNEISKFYELAVMQLEGCLSIVHAETESSFLESNHEELLDDLREIKSRLQWRLKESELAILEKDKELMHLRHALELKEREPVLCRGIQESTQSGDDEHSELRTSLDQQMLNIEHVNEPQHEILSEVQRSGSKKVEEMGSDIDILKQTMDLAFGKMQSALLMCEMKPKEREWKLTIEKDIMSILIGSIMKEFQDNIEEEIRRDENQVLKVWKEQWSPLMNEFKTLRHELASFHETCPEDSDCSNISSPTSTKPSSPEGNSENSNYFSLKVEEMDKKGKLAEEEEMDKNEDGSTYVAKMIKSHESIIRRKSEEMNWNKHGVLLEKRSRRRRELNRVKERTYIVAEKLDSLMHLNVKLCETGFNQRAIHDKELFSGRKLSEANESYTSKDVVTLESAMEKVRGACDAKNKNQEELIKVSHTEKEYSKTQNSISEDLCGSTDDLEKQIQESVYEYCLREVINEWNENIERNTIERKIADDMNFIVMSDLVMDISRKAEEHLTSCLRSSNQVEKIKNIINEDISKLLFRQTVDEFNKMMVDSKEDSVINEQIHQIVFGETLKNFVNIASSASKEQHRENRIQKKFLDQLQITIIESSLKEDVCMTVFTVMLEEWKVELDDYYMQNFIRENIKEVILVETLNDAFLLTMEVKSLVHNNIIEDSCSTMRLNQVVKVQGEENLTTMLLECLLSCFEAEENLMLSAKSEIKEHSKQLDLGSERGDLEDNEIFEDLLTGEEQAFSSLTSKVENVLQQLGIGKALLMELGTSLGHSLSDSESFHDKMATNEDSSTLLPLLNLLLRIAEFGEMICQKFDMMTRRLEKMKRCLDPVIELVGCLRSKELLYQKAFIKRCQNLQKAEVEVDLLGDQVDALLTLVEKIYVALHQHAPTLQQYFEVYDILELIRRELTGGSVQTESVMI
ncbi:hypothetical protein RJT34_26629 [Clitoria ternatea]|uniref:WPP domain-associated protein n=1 Tax=Clitoria ternatea TaxID=43366 RepID=A0AAN9F9E1_CLITE